MDGCLKAHLKETRHHNASSSSSSSSSRGEVNLFRPLCGGGAPHHQTEMKKANKNKKLFSAKLPFFVLFVLNCGVVHQIAVKTILKRGGHQGGRRKR